MNDRATTCCFTGHRINKLDWGLNENDERCVRLKLRLNKAIENAYDMGIRSFICGVANGCDMYFAEELLDFRKNHPDIILEAAIPYRGQADYWQEDLRRRYDNILKCFDYHTMVSELYSKQCMMRRNQYMVDCSSLLIAAYNGDSGGTMNTMLYAMRQGLEIIEIEIPK